MPLALPTRTTARLGYIFDSRNWDGFVPRDGDIVISTSYKSGTTWMQNIALRLIFDGGAVPAVSDVSPWLDRRNLANAETLVRLAAQTHRRVIKSHLPLDAIFYHACVRYIVVVRDARDVFMSFWNHYSNYTDDLYNRVNDPDTLIGPPMPRCPEDIHACWTDWINRGWFEGETEGYPHSGNLYHTQTWWRFRHLDNILFVHFNDLLADLPGEIARIAAYLDIPLTQARLAAIAADLRFDALKKNAAAAGPMAEEFARRTWTEGLETFFFKGTNGRWKSVLSLEELAMYHRAKARVLSPDCALFLETGRAALPETGTHPGAALTPEGVRPTAGAPC